MRFIIKYFIIVTSPLILSYIVPLIFIKQQQIKTYYPGSWHDQFYIKFTHLQVAEALLLVIVWFLASLIVLNAYCFILRRNNSKKKICDINDATINYKYLLIFYILFFIFGTAISIVHNFIYFKGSIEEIVHQLSLMPIFTMSLGLYIISKYKLQLKSYQIYILFFLNILSFSTVFILYTLVSRIAYVLYFLLSIYIIFDCYAKNNKTKIYLILFLLFLTPILMTVKVYIRNNFYENGITRIESVEALKLIQSENFKTSNLFLIKINEKKLDIKQEIYQFNDFDEQNNDNYFFKFTEENTYYEYVLRRVISRANHLNSSIYFNEIFPVEYPYFGIAYLKTIFFGLVPRFFWDEKPRNEGGNAIPVKVKLLPPTDRTTSFNLNIIEEAISFNGVIGIIIFSLIYSFLIVLIFFISNHCNELNNLLLPVCAFTLLNTESGLYGIFNGVLHTIFIYSLAIYLINFVIKKVK